MKIYTDGSSTGKVGSGGWAFLVVNDDESEGLLFSGNDQETTNNRMELKAIISALEYCLEIGLKKPVIISDSQYAIGVLTRQFRASTNLDLVESGRVLVHRVHPSLFWVRGHSKNQLHDIVDQEAKRVRLASERIPRGEGH